MLLKHSALYLLAIGLSGIVNLAAIPILTRLVSPEAYGQYALVVAGVGLFNVVLFRWLSLGLLRFLPAYQEKQDVFLSTIFVGFAVIVGLTGVSAVIALPFLADPLHRWLVAIGLILLWGSAFFELNKELVRCRFSPSRYGVLTLVKATIALGVGAGLAYLGYGADGLLYGLILGLLLPGFWQMWRDWRTVRPRFASSALFRQLLLYGLPLTATFALKFVVNSSDRFFLGYLLHAEATGLYSVSYDLASHSLGIFMMVVNLAAYPLAVKALEQKGRDAADVQLSQNVLLLLGISLLLLLVSLWRPISPKSFSGIIPNCCHRTDSVGYPGRPSFGAQVLSFRPEFFNWGAIPWARYGLHWQLLPSTLFLTLVDSSFGFMGAAYATMRLTR
ncbi:MAG: lipopolysaccharide biosynthesis protein [Syntrophotaleaceae bacterium]